MSSKNKKDKFLRSILNNMPPEFVSNYKKIEELGKVKTDGSLNEKGQKMVDEISEDILKEMEEEPEKEPED